MILKQKYKDSKIEIMVVSIKTYNKELNEYNIPIYMLPFI